MSRKFALLLCVVLLLAYISKTNDYLFLFADIADNMMAVIGENPAPENISKIIGSSEIPIILPWKIRNELRGAKYQFSVTLPNNKGNYFFYVYVNDNSIVGMSGENVYFFLPKGVTYEELEKMYITKLTECFKSHPKVTRRKTVVESNIFEWTVNAKENLYYITLHVIYTNRRSVPIYALRYLWVKRDDIYISLYMKVDENVDLFN